jgi:hypothetical protein
LDWSDLKKPANLIGISLAVLGIGLTVVTFVKSRQSAAVSFHVNEIQVFDRERVLTTATGSSNSSHSKIPFSVLDSSGLAIDQNIFVANVTVWNSGDLDLGIEKMRRPITVSVSGKPRLLDAEITYTTRDNLSEFHVQNAPTDDGFAQVSWKYFDAGDGFRLRLIYSSTKQEEIIVDAIVSGVNQITNATTVKGHISIKFVALIGVSLIFFASSFYFLYSARWLHWSNTLDPSVTHQSAKLGGFRSVTARRMVLLPFLLAISALGVEIAALWVVSNPPGPPF